MKRTEFINPTQSEFLGNNTQMTIWMLMGRTASCFSSISVPSSALILLGEGATLSILMISIRIQPNIIFLETWLNIYIEKFAFVNL